VVPVALNTIAQNKGVAALVQLHRAFVVQQQELDASIGDKRTAAPTAAAPTSSSGGSSSGGGGTVLLTPSLANAFAFTLLQLSSVVENRGLLVQQGGVRLLLDLYAQAAKPSDDPHAAVSEENSSPNSPSSPYRCWQDLLSALARTFISTNPALVGDAYLPGVALALLDALAGAEHELLVFEALLALTNIASFGAGDDGGVDMAEFICAGAGQQRGGSKAKPKAAATSGSSSSGLSPDSSSSRNGWYLAKSQLASSNPLVQRAAVELLTNLVNCAWARRKLRGVEAELAAARGEKVTAQEHAASVAAAAAHPGREQSEDLRLLLAFSLSEDLATARAATGALAMLASDPLIAARIAHTSVTSFVPLDQAQERNEEKRREDERATDADAAPAAQAHAPPNTRAVVRTGVSICRRLMSDPNTHPDVKLRVEHILKSIS